MQEQLDLFCEQNRIYGFEGERGVENLVTIARALGYGDSPSYESDDTVLVNFLSDNGGAMEAIYNWIGETNVLEWRLKLEALTLTQLGV